MSSLLTHTGETSAKCVSVGDTAGSCKGNLRKSCVEICRPQLCSFSAKTWSKYLEGHVTCKTVTANKINPVRVRQTCSEARRRL